MYENMPDGDHEDLSRTDIGHDMGEEMERKTLFDSLPEKVKENELFMHGLCDRQSINQIYSIALPN